ARIVARARSGVDVEVDLDLVQLPQDLDVLSKRAIEPVPGEVGWAELEDQRPQLVERLASELAGAVDLGAGAGLATVEQRRRRLGGQHEAEQLLADDVVELEGDPVSFREHRQLAASLVEPRV